MISDFRERKNLRLFFCCYFFFCNLSIIFSLCNSRKASDAIQRADFVFCSFIFAAVSIASLFKFKFRLQICLSDY